MMEKYTQPGLPTLDCAECPTNTPPQSSIENQASTQSSPPQQRQLASVHPPQTTPPKMQGVKIHSMKANILNVLNQTGSSGQTASNIAKEVGKASSEDVIWALHKLKDEGCVHIVSSASSDVLWQAGPPVSSQATFLQASEDLVLPHHGEPYQPCRVKQAHMSQPTNEPAAESGQIVRPVQVEFNDPQPPPIEPVSSPDQSNFADRSKALGSDKGAATDMKNSASLMHKTNTDLEEAVLETSTSSLSSLAFNRSSSARSSLTTSNGATHAGFTVGDRSSQAKASPQAKARKKKRKHKSKKKS